ncbi:MAG TPA: hypothetical protein DCX14_06980 [Flavobacteriales bacterium]|jgi:hypothetical protein|nr:hypothetical protein [Flavobacteriales bacterium]HAW19908.1 hypothetical protein [Flavobacteriales bacterium]
MKTLFTLTSIILLSAFTLQAQVESKERKMEPSETKMKESTSTGPATPKHAPSEEPAPHGENADHHAPHHDANHEGHEGHNHSTGVKQI